MWAIAKQVPVTPEGIKTACGCCKPQLYRLSNVHRKRRSPGVVYTLGGVMRPTGTLVPRMRQAPDGCK